MIEISTAQTNPDVAVTSVIPSKTVVRLSDTVNITVSIANQGTENATFNVAVYRGSIILQNKTVNDLASNRTTNLVFSWNTTDVSGEINALSSKEKTYDINAVAQTLLGETDTADNTLTSASRIRVVSRYITVLPERTLDQSLTTGKNFTVSIYTDYNGSDVWGWQVTLTFNEAVLQVVEVRSGDLVSTAKDATAAFPAPYINNTIGEVSAGALFDLSYPSAPFMTSGPGILATVTFRVVGTGYSNITIEKSVSKLLSFNADPAVYLSFDIINDYLPYINHLLPGYFGNSETGTIDVAVVSVTPSPTSVTIGDTVEISVVVENLGTLDASFDAKAYFDYNPAFPAQNVIETKSSESLGAGADKTLVFTWDTEGVAEGDHVITAVVSSVSGETSANNNRLDSTQKVTVKSVVARPLPITEIAIGIVVFIIVVVVIILVLRRRRLRRQAASEES